MQVVAKLRFARISPQKCRLVADQIRGQSVSSALKILAFSRKKAARMMHKVLESAIANAEHNHGADIDELKVATVQVDGAPFFARYAATDGEMVALLQDLVQRMLAAKINGAHAVFLRSYPREGIPDGERRLAPVLALAAGGIYALIVAGLWLLYAIGVPS